MIIFQSFELNQHAPGDLMNLWEKEDAMNDRPDFAASAAIEIALIMPLRQAALHMRKAHVPLASAKKRLVPLKVLKVAPGSDLAF